ncbi:MAG: transketolase [Bacteroidetes bacterium]|uniref:transketolase n=1 Tax=Candidatus Caccoplasma merdipullorum TaxID=2840718 RepID=A0A9D9E2R0_9BACT|nr:transketolase [Candidatus Caccoplasma merdipullorum]
MSIDKKIQERVSDNIRVLTVAMVEKAKSGHPGGAMGGADFINTLYSKIMVFDPDDSLWINRDRFFLDPGHMSPMLYAVLAMLGKYTIDEIKDFRQWGCVTPGHPELNFERGIENTSGPLGQGHAMAVGAAMAERFMVARFGEWMAHKTYAFISDGGIQEEISQGAGRMAGYFGLSNLIMFFDSNNIQLSTSVEDVTTEDTAAKYRSWNWNVIEIDGNDSQQVYDALTAAQNEKRRPTLIIGHTVMGKGIVKEDGSNFEGQCSTHGQPISAAGASVEKTILNLGGNPDDPFAIFPESVQLYEERKNELRKIVAQRKAEQAEWEKANPEKAELLKKYYSGHIPEIDYRSIQVKPGVATRVASSAVLSVLSEKVGNMVVSSADLANSDKTDGFLKHTHPFKPYDFTGAFLHAGVSEITMAAIMNGMVLHGGMIAASGTFFVFSDYIKPVARMSALMRLPVKYIWTHDAFRVGEDGPTHQPVEQEAQIRLLEELKNHKGKNSMLVLRPADSAETVIAWKLAMENTDSPTAMILSRQNVNDIPAMNGDRYEEALQMAKGAYIVYKDEDPDVIMVASGSEVSTLMAAVPLLHAEGIKVRVVSAPSTGLFFDQTPEYRNSVIPLDKPIFGLTAGLPSAMARLVGINGVVWGLDHFGYSAPYKVLDDKFGFSAENVLKQVKKMLNK